MRHLIPSLLLATLVVIDGDSILLDGVEMRMEGIDAPELHQTCQDSQSHEFACGEVARAVLVDLLAKGAVTCQPDGTDRYDRVLAHCISGGAEVNGAMVDQGMARAFTRYSGEYIANEADAIRKRRGLWAGLWQWLPIEYRLMRNGWR